MNERPYLLTKALWALGAGEELNKIESFVEKHYIDCERYFVRDDQPGMRCPGET